MFGRTKLSQITILKIDGAAIEWSNKTKYLGITISRGPRRPSMWDHITNVEQRPTKTRDILLPSDQQKQPNISTYHLNNFENVLPHLRRRTMAP